MDASSSRFETYFTPSHVVLFLHKCISVTKHSMAKRVSHNAVLNSCYLTVEQRVVACVTHLLKDPLIVDAHEHLGHVQFLHHFTAWVCQCNLHHPMQSVIPAIGSSKKKHAHADTQKYLSTN